MGQKDYDFPKFLRLLLFSADFLLIPLSVYKKTKVLQCPQDSSEGPELLSFDSGAEYHSQGKQCEVCVETAFQGQGLYKILDKRRGVKSMIRWKRLKCYFSLQHQQIFKQTGNENRQHYWWRVLFNTNSCNQFDRKSDAAA